jgi:hypothetical protein
MNLVVTKAPVSLTCCKPPTHPHCASDVQSNPQNIVKTKQTKGRLRYALRNCSRVETQCGGPYSYTEDMSIAGLSLERQSKQWTLTVYPLVTTHGPTGMACAVLYPLLLLLLLPHVVTKDAGMI